jgi:hypothetical protein
MEGAVRARSASPRTAGGGAVVVGLPGFTILMFCGGTLAAPETLLA